ncbi:N-acetylmuramoyl-L-alanine amidase family protein [[Clostridium] bifermentans ATCC 638]|uniref:N-acetylmuramoyl-L-alanine amidase family protein n=1 Tax=Paraclostridium bifermentans ATCC 638 = DSM 14991 TaxID=1233171 RepID=T4VMS1_PARBF|nr:N-acetylmuramoyl-L-alanine amidase [Paraclostridium bifermentans]EQK42788.1 N-acetylmuramoyl-L-alanine amidase family protein [[Clostridium] bifermentans ATCC 638] [Paraclostridium bifermentans ATCC 638 = DSM 14991]RIZ58464.1 N-acetylmuramoyl-L-alanine amidase [Paraclostridium bifermentans]UAG19584.1 N-acetylmuramoyl-L-alanine amidase [Paraclostridium bifermentans]
MAMYKVYLDAGHGGNDSGAVGVRNVFEKNIVLDICNRIKKILESRNVEVRMSRSTDVFKTLSQRTSDANKWGADALVSIHCNSFKDLNSKGLETFCLKFKYRKLADCIHDELINDKLYTVNRGVKEGNLHMVRESNMAACLIELGFISNAEDLNLIESKKDEFALAIADGICNYLGVKFNSNPPIQKVEVYNIITGGFGSKENAQKQLDYLHGLTGWYLELEEQKPGDWRIRTGGFTGEGRVKREMAALTELTGWWCTYEKEK